MKNIVGSFSQFADESKITERHEDEVDYNALCSYPLKLGSPKFLKVKAQFSLNFVSNSKISVLTG